MQQRQCGKHDLKLSALGAGCWAFGGGKYWGDQNQKDVDEVVRYSVDLGITYFDSAEAYNEGRSEESLGLALKGIPRDTVLVGTKVSPSNCYPDMLVEHCEASLRRLGTDYIDIYMIHWPIHPHSIRHFTEDEAVISNPPLVDDALDTLLTLRSSGKIRRIGVSNFAATRLKGIESFLGEVVLNELPYSLLTRAIELETLPCTVGYGMGTIGYMTLLQGLLADIYPTLSDVPPYQRRTRHFNCTSTELCRHGEEGAEEETNEALAGIRRVMKESGMTMPEIAVKWALANSAITCALVGARTKQELEANVKAAGQPLPADIAEKLNEVTRPLMEKLGKGFDYYESTENDRTV
ncbi:MAG: hypothetical protein GF418_10910 [Chitinivibrionales bacterium]|nr:hypothetical protein [Chitinivibrionales bacterium]MBD3396125.1 hypothetical protein [Chitinivibrionales bacterium]